jgi:hypothetical protein
MRELPTILPTTKQVVGNGHLQTDLDGKNKKALYLQAITELLRHSWTSNFLPRNLFNILDLLSHLLNQHLQLNRRLGDFGADGF